MSDPVCGPRACDIVANYIFRIARVLSKAKLNKEINFALLFDILLYYNFYSYTKYLVQIRLMTRC